MLHWKLELGFVFINIVKWWAMFCLSFFTQISELGHFFPREVSRLDSTGLDHEIFNNASLKIYSFIFHLLLMSYCTIELSNYNHWRLSTHCARIELNAGHICICIYHSLGAAYALWIISYIGIYSREGMLVSFF